MTGLPFPKALRQMSAEALSALCLALQQHMAKAYAGQPSLLHSLAATALTLALHRVFRAPYEAVLFEKEAHALAHRLLTGWQPGFASPSQAPHPEDCFNASHGPWALAHAAKLLEARKLSGHAGKVVAILEEKRPLHKESFEALSQPGAADLPWVLVLAREGEGEEAFLPKPALAAFFGSLGFWLWPTLDGSHLGDMEAALRQAKQAHKAVVVHVRLVSPI